MLVIRLVPLMAKALATLCATMEYVSESPSSSVELRLITVSPILASSFNGWLVPLAAAGVVNIGAA